MNTFLHTEARIGRGGSVQRRDFLRTLAAGGAGLAGLGWVDRLSLEAAELRKQGKACILLWMQGGPSQFETFSPKPEHDNGGETKAIATSVPGVRYSENLPLLAKRADDLCVIRSVTSREGSHPRATFLMHTAYIPMASVKYPAIGSHVAHQLGDVEADLPSFVRVGPARQASGIGGGILGVQYDPFAIPEAGSPPRNTTIATGAPRYRRRLKLLGRLEETYAENGGRKEVEDHQQLYAKSSRMVLSPKMKAFDLSEEPESVRREYGEGDFAKGCLLARRLLESGVTFVEVNAGNWDTHFDNFNRSRTLAGQVDRPAAALIDDLRRRGMLDDTLIIWMGEFGRTPRINPRGGRDHFPRAFNVALAGCGVRGGQVIGRTDAGGEEVTERPVSVNDLFCTYYHALGIDPEHENMSPIGRPIKIVDGGAAVKEVFG